jgi:hypothetical protein
MARGAWDRTAAVMYVIACAAPGGLKKDIRPDDLNPYRRAQKGEAALAAHFSGLRALKADQDRRAAEAAANGEPHGG